MEPVYLDNNATTKMAPEVVEAMLPYFSEYYGNPSSMHSFGGNVGRKVRHARQQLADLIGAEPDEIIYTGCGTESDSTAIHAALHAFPDRRHIITSRVEHPAIKSRYEHLEKDGYRITFVPVDQQGRLDLEDLERNLTDDTAIVSIMWANNETGAIFPINKIARMVTQQGILFHTDAVQAVGKIPIDLKALPIDMLSLSGHKFHGPKGMGALYVRKGTPFKPLLMGGHQEQGRRAGTENVAGIIGLGRAAKLAQSHLTSDMKQVQKLRDRLQTGLLERIPQTFINAQESPRLPNTLSIAFEYVEGEAILLHMDQYGICASSGSACTSGSLEPSHVLRAMGVPFTAAHGSIRFSLSAYTTQAEIDLVIEKLPPIIDNLRKMSPFGR